MSSIPKYVQLIRHIRNWPLYFSRLHDKGRSAVYITRGAGLSMEVPPNFYQVFREIFMEDFYRITDLAKHLPDEPLVVDIGGNVGYFSFLLASKKNSAVIFAFEPMAENVALFRSNLQLNAGLEKRITVFQKAVTGNFNGTLDIFFDNVTDNSVVASVMNDFSEQNTAKRTAEAITLEKFVADNHIGRIDLLKLDCEGSEYPVLYDSPEHILALVQTIAIETHDLDKDQRNAAALIKFLESKGFTIEKHLAENHCYYVKAFRNN